METIFHKIKKHGKFYTSLNERYKVESESFDIDESEEKMTIQSKLVLQHSKLNPFVKLLVKMVSFSIIKLHITIILHKNVNKLTYVLQTLDREVNFESCGSIVFNNKNKIITHDTKFHTEYSILKLQEFNKVIKKRLESDICLIFSNLQKLK